MNRLAVDLGGTKTLCLLYRRSEGEIAPLHRAEYQNDSFSDATSLLRSFLDEAGASASAESACIAVAGPVRGNHARVTNLPWELEAGALSESLAIAHVELINDLAAAAWGLDLLKTEECVMVQAGTPIPGGPRLVIGAGTGLGAALALPEADGWRVLPTEAGHADFASTDAAQDALLTALRPSIGRVSVERLLSGSGLLRIYRTLGGDTCSNPAAVHHAARSRGDLAAVKAMDLFIRIYGAVAGNLALTTLPTGGVYVVGGIAPRILPELTGGPFIEAFRAKAPMVELMESLPVSIVTRADTGLLGATRLAP